jgi:hypothetical protein
MHPAASGREHRSKAPLNQSVLQGGEKKNFFSVLIFRVLVFAFVFEHLVGVCGASVSARTSGGRPTKGQCLQV